MIHRRLSHRRGGRLAAWPLCAWRGAARSIAYHAVPIRGAPGRCRRAGRQSAAASGCGVPAHPPTPVPTTRSLRARHGPHVIPTACLCRRSPVSLWSLCPAWSGRFYRPLSRRRTSHPRSSRSPSAVHAAQPAQQPPPNVIPQSQLLIHRQPPKGDGARIRRPHIPPSRTLLQHPDNPLQGVTVVRPRTVPLGTTPHLRQQQRQLPPLLVRQHWFDSTHETPFMTGSFMLPNRPAR